jgi:hypothetical protein
MAADRCAGKARLTRPAVAGTQVVAVNGTAFDADRGAIRNARKADAPPTKLLVRNGDRYRTVHLDHHGGLRYPRLEREATAPARLDQIRAAGLTPSDGRQTFARSRRTADRPLAPTRIARGPALADAAWADFPVVYLFGRLHARRRLAQAFGLIGYRRDVCWRSALLGVLPVFGACEQLPHPLPKAQFPAPVDLKSRTIAVSS